MNNGLVYSTIVGFSFGWKKVDTTALDGWELVSVDREGPDMANEKDMAAMLLTGSITRVSVFTLRTVGPWSLARVSQLFTDVVDHTL